MEAVVDRPDDTDVDDAAVTAFEAEVARVAGVRNAADARLVELVARALESGWWQGWRVHTPVQWLMWRAGLERSTAQRVVALARRAAELPSTMAAFTEGRLSLDQAAKVARYTPTEFEASVCELAESATVAQITAATRRYDFDAHATPPEPTPAEPVLPSQDPEVERHVSFGTDEGGQWWARARLPIDEGMVVEEALRVSREQLHRARRTAAQEAAAIEGRSTEGTDTALGVPRVSWADALVGAARSVLAGGAAGADRGTRTRLLVHLEAPAPAAAPTGEPGSSAAGQSHGHPHGGESTWLATVHGGPRLPDALRRHLSCDAEVQAVWEVGGRSVQLGRAQRIVPRRIRRLIEHRDRGCRVPGCDQHLGIEVHHIVHWEDDGETVTWNLLCLCSFHHRLHHQGLLGITGDADRPDGVVFTDARGSALAPAGRARPPTSADLPVVTSYSGPTGEHLDRSAVCFSRRDPTQPSRAGPGPPRRDPSGGAPRSVDAA